MGAQNMFQVMAALEGADVSLVDWDEKKRAVVNGCGRVRRLSAYDLAFMTAIAYRQHDVAAEEKSPWTDNECFCVGSEGSLAELARMKRTKFEESRAFMMAKGLVTYRESDVCLDLKTGARRKQYKYVYRINKPALSRLKDTLPGKREVLARQAVGACQASTNITYNNNTNSSMPKPGSAVVDKYAVDKKAADRERAKFYINHIAQKYALSDEQRRQIGIEGIVAGTAGKRPEDIIREIDQLGKEEMLKQKFGTWVGMLVKHLKELPKSDAPNNLPSAEELEAQFSPPKVISEIDRKKQMALNAWNQLCVGMGLQGLSDARLNELYAAYKKMVGSRWQHLEEAIEKIMKDAPFVKEKSMTFEEYRKLEPAVNARANKLLEEITQTTWR